MDLCDKEKAELVPEDGWLLKPVEVTFQEGQNVFDVLQQSCRDNKIHLEFSVTPVYNSAYIEGIGNLYEFDCGEESGWMYAVNGKAPNVGIADYKVLCFNSETKIIQVCEGRQKKGGVKFGFYDTSWNELDIKRAKHNTIEHSVSKPNALEEMLEVSRKLSKGLKFIRVDFYIVNDRLYCGELTFYPGSGFEGFEPEEYDKIMGDWIDL